MDYPKLVPELVHLSSVFELSGFIPEAEIPCTFLIKAKGTRFQTLLYTGRATILISVPLPRGAGSLPCPGVRGWNWRRAA